MTRRERVALRRKELLAEWDKRFKIELLQEVVATNFDYKDAFLRAVRTLDRHLQELIKNKPQEKEFIFSCAREWQNKEIANMNAVLGK